MSRRRSIHSGLRRGHSAGGASAAAAATINGGASAETSAATASSTQPLDGFRNIMELASGQLNQILAEFGITPSTDTFTASGIQIISSK